MEHGICCQLCDISVCWMGGNKWSSTSVSQCWAGIVDQCSPNIGTFTDNIGLYIAIHFQAIFHTIRYDTFTKDSPLMLKSNIWVIFIVLCSIQR